MAAINTNAKIVSSFYSWNIKIWFSPFMIFDLMYIIVNDGLTMQHHFFWGSMVAVCLTIKKCFPLLLRNLSTMIRSYTFSDVKKHYSVCFIVHYTVYNLHFFQFSFLFPQLLQIIKFEKSQVYIRRPLEKCGKFVAKSLILTHLWCHISFFYFLFFSYLSSNFSFLSTNFFILGM